MKNWTIKKKMILFFLVLSLLPLLISVLIVQRKLGNYIDKKEIMPLTNNIKTLESTLSSHFKSLMVDLKILSKNKIYNDALEVEFGYEELVSNFCGLYKR